MKIYNVSMHVDAHAYVCTCIAHGSIIQVCTFYALHNFCIYKLYIYRCGCILACV